jgi:hypothetical protein
MDGAFDARPRHTRPFEDRPPVAPLIRKAFKGVLVVNSDFDFARGQAAAAANRFAKDIALAVEG